MKFSTTILLCFFSITLISNAELSKSIVEETRRKAKAGNMDYQDLLGILYDHAMEGVTQDFTEAAKWYRKAAEQGWTLSMPKLAAMYENGRGVPQDYTEAVKWYRKAAEQGCSISMRKLAQMYEDGRGVPQDYTEAVKLYRKDIEQGSYTSFLSKYSLGNMYEDGRGVPQDYTEAVKLWRAGAEFGDKFAQSNLGRMYYLGRGVPEDYVLSYMWFNLAASKNLSTAKKNKDIIAKLMTKEQIADAQKMSRDWEAKPLLRE
jgi:TPR repeat protein